MYFNLSVETSGNDPDTSPTCKACSASRLRVRTIQEGTCKGVQPLSLSPGLHQGLKMYVDSCLGRAEFRYKLSLLDGSSGRPEKKWATSIYTFHEACLPSLTRCAPLHHLPLALCSLTALPLLHTLANLALLVAPAWRVPLEASILLPISKALAWRLPLESSTLLPILGVDTSNLPHIVILIQHSAWRRHRKGSPIAQATW